MKKFNLVKSLTRVINNHKGLLILCLSLAAFGVNEAWGGSDTYYGKFSVAVSTNSTGMGKVYAADNNSATSGDGSVPISTESKGGSVSAYAFAKPNAGYHLQGWSKTNGNSDLGTNNPYTMSGNASGTKDGTYNNGTWYATFAANTDTKYTVKHYQENADGSYPANPTETDNLTGTTDTKVTPARKSYTGFTAPAGEELTIKGDGSASVSYNYTRNSYTLTWNLDGGTITTAGTPAGQVKYGATLSAPVPSKTGAQFKGWSPEVPATMPAENVTYTALWVSKYDFEMRGEDRSMKVDEELPNAFTFDHAENPTPKISIISIDPINNGDGQVIEYDAINNKIIAHNAGTATIYFKQTETTNIYAGTSDTYTITVSKIANTLAADATKSMKVDETWSNVINGKNSDAAVTTTTSDETVAYYDVANNKIVAPNSSAKSFNSTEVTITISQEATYKYTAAEKTIKVTVKKWDNNIFINGSKDSYATSIYMDAEHSIALTATNTDYSGSPITATQTAGKTIAALNAEQTQVTANYNLGNATWTVSQSENYKYKAANASFTINVGLAPREKCLTLEIADAVELEGHGKNPKEYDITLGKDLTFKAKRSATGIGTLMIDIYVGNQWVNIFDKNPGKVIETIIGIESEVDYDTYSVLNIDSTATKIKFYTSSLADYKKYYKNVEITRRSYLNASDFTINTQSDNTTLVYPGKTGTGSFHVDYSLANGGDLKIVCDNPKFTIDKTTQTDVDCKSGSFNVNMTYTSQTAGTDYAHVVIYNNVYRKEITVTGITQKHQQTLKWKDNFDQMSKGGEEKNAATSSHGLVTYKSSNPNAIRVDNDANGNATILVAVAKGESKITATAAGDDEYEEISIEKTISVTEKCVQYIVWTQSLMGLKLNDPNRILNAYATSEIEECTSNNGGRLVTYTSADESVVKVVNTNELQIVGVGTTTVTAHQAGGLDSDKHDYEPATKENTVVVKDPSAKCEAFVYEQNGDAEQFFAMNTSEITGTEHTLSGEPAKITFRAKREYWNLAINYSKGNIVLDAYTPTGGWQQVLDCGEPPIGSYQEYSKELSRDVTKIRFRRPKGGQGYHYIADTKVEMLRYIETSTPSTFQANVGEQQQQTIYLSYSNITSDLLLSMASGANSHFSVDKTQITGDCGAVAKNVALTISYAPTKNTEELGEETETLIISDGTTTTNVALKGTANRVARSIVWDINDQNTVYTIQTVNLNATAKTNLQQEAGNVAYNISPSSTEGCGSINNNVLSFAKAGNVSVVATTIEDAKYLPAVAVTKSWTVSKTPTTITTNPTIGDVVSGTALDAIVLQGGEAQNTVNNQAVEGTFAVTDGDLVNVGEQTLTITFTPNNTDMYEGCTTTIVANVVQREATAEEVGTPSAAPIIYGSVINTSALSGNGSLAGTWSWVDEDANKATPNVGTIDNLNVIFTPNDGNIKPATTTVSLTVTAATPTLTWTAKEETAQVHETKTFTASSTNTDNTAAITYSIISDGDNATIDASTGEVTMLKAGTITIQASQAATTNFAAPSSITTTCTISQAPTKITTNPEIDGDIVYGAQLSDLKLKDNTGAARNTVNQEAVEGTFSITDGDLSAAGEKTITVTFTPANTDMYASCTSTVPVTIQKAEPDAVAHASEIIYGAAVGTSVLTNDGTTAGTWTWTDEKKDQVLEVGTHEGLNVHFTPTDKTNYNEIDGTVSLTVKKATATLTWTTAPESADVKDKLTYTATSNHSESVIIYAITSGADCATIDASTGALTITKAGTITVQASQDATTHYEAAEITVTTTLTGEFENVFSGEGDWNDPENWTYGVPTSANPDIVVSGSLTISEPISVGGLTIEANGKVTIVGNGDLTVNGTSGDRETYGNLFVRNGGDVTISENANVKVFDFVVESSIGTEGQSVSGQVKHSDRVIYTNGAYIDINMDPSGKMDDTQWYAFTVPFPVDVQNGVARKEGDVFRKCTYGVEYMICEYDINQRLNTGKGWKYIKSGKLQPGQFYYITVNGDYNVYSFKAAESAITIHNTTKLKVNGEGANANWNAVGNSTLTYTTISGEKIPNYVQTYLNGKSQYMTVATDDAQFVVGCPFFFQASEEATMILNEANKTVDTHYAPRQESVDKPVCVRIAEEGKHFSDQIYLTASQEATGEYTLGRDLAKAGIGTKSAQLWMNAYGQKLSVQDATLMGDQAYYELSIYAPKADSYELSLPKVPANAVIYLTQNGYPIWNLNETPYVIECYKGTTNEYGLLLRLQEGGSPTDMQTMRSSEKVQKIMKDQRIYINANSQLYDLMGQKVK